MRRIAVIAMVLPLALVLFGTPAFAKQCPKLINDINAMVGNRFDAAAADARAKAAQAQTLHNEGKHAESEKAATEALSALKK